MLVAAKEHKGPMFCALSGYHHRFIAVLQLLHRRGELGWMHRAAASSAKALLSVTALRPRDALWMPVYALRRGLERKADALLRVKLP
ncbi:hypothetical protein PsYK624_097280 [Phanerochaete sordida]|uniref:Uncharacterized protein n=1 Tax=Phanerochaete sordida TaxID=48140 RepID=A0A9P3GFX9_9APHY|nr:hypothetical protein PsYK624_097280 [Phanerochaete sordida]